MKLKKFTGLLLCAALALSMAACKFTTPAVVMTVEGEDIPAGYGAQILAAASGTVVTAGWVSGYGNYPRGPVPDVPVSGVFQRKKQAGG